MEQKKRYTYYKDKRYELNLDNFDIDKPDLNPFFDPCWKTDASQNKHFDYIAHHSVEMIGSGKPEGQVPDIYGEPKRYKKWDVDFEEYQTAVEYRSASSENDSIKKCWKDRIAEAKGYAYDVKELNPNYKLMYLFVFVFNPKHTNHLHLRRQDWIIHRMNCMVDSGLYDCFCPIQTSGIGNHIELSETNSFSNFMKTMKQFCNRKIEIASTSPLYICA